MIDDHPLFRQGLAFALREHPGVAVVAEAGNAAEARAAITNVEMDVAVVDLLMPEISGISLAAEIHERQPTCRILGLSVVDEPGLIADMLRAQATGFALKTQPVHEIIEAIHHVLGGMQYLPPSVPRAVVEAELRTEPDRPLQALTPREREVFELLIRGYSNCEIATRLYIAPRTVETHRQRVMNKLSARSILQLQRLAVRHGASRG